MTGKGRCWLLFLRVSDPAIIELASLLMLVIPMKEIDNDYDREVECQISDIIFDIYLMQY